MSEATVEKKLPVRNLERIAEKKFPSFEDADRARSGGKHEGQVKAKIFARYDGTFDLVFYRKVGTKDAPVKVAQAPETASEAPEKKVHGLRSKDRKKSPKKAR